MIINFYQLDYNNDLKVKQRIYFYLQHDYNLGFNSNIKGLVICNLIQNIWFMDSRNKYKYKDKKAQHLTKAISNVGFSGLQKALISIIFVQGW